MRVLFTTVALPGHFFPLVPTAWAARALGHDVLVAATEAFAPVVRRAGLPVASSGPATDFVGMVADDWDSHTTAERRHTNGRAFAAIAERSLSTTRELVRSWQPDVVVSERAEFAGRVAASAHDVPFVELQWGVAPLEEYHAAATDALGRLPKPVLTLNPWPPSLRLAHTAGHASVRHISYTGDAHVPEWLWRPGDRPRVCFTMGTVLPHLKPEQAALTVLPTLAALSDLDIDLVVAVDDKIAASWTSLPAAIRHIGRLPLSHVLPTCDVAIHHGGHGTALTALDAGVPQLVLPVFDDQLDNAAAVVSGGAGLSLTPAEASPAAIVEHCERLRGETRFRVGATAVAHEIACQPAPVDVAASIAALAARRWPQAA